MKLYETTGFPNPLRIAVALLEKNAADQVERIEVNVMGGEHRTPEFVKKNPLAVVPVLELDDGTFIGETTAITEYLDHTFAGPSLTGSTPKERAIVHMMQRRAEIMVIETISTYFHHATDGMGPELEVYQNKDWGLKQKEKALQGLAYFNDVLGQSTYVSGEDFTMADISLLAGLVFAKFGQIEIDPALTHLIDWHARISARPSVQAVMG
jgi:glutathione S-transferase